MVFGQSALAGLIPAHAGKTRTSRLYSYTVRAHPRSRGENRGVYRYSEDPEGSSPLTRGKLQLGHHVLPVHGLIPAHAGKTSRPRLRSRRRRAHPRSRGENRSIRRPRAGRMGSSPLTRGKRPAPAWRGQDNGLIPAHAGKTTPGPRYARPWRAHPRSRGENARRSAANDVYGGSSPLTRGKLGLGREASAGHGLIPAHAGKTRRSSR